MPKDLLPKEQEPSLAEKTQNEQGNPQRLKKKRDAWMLSDDYGLISGKNKRTTNASTQYNSYKELNPYFADGGSGLPPQYSAQNNEIRLKSSDQLQAAARTPKNNTHNFTSNAKITPVYNNRSNGGGVCIYCQMARFGGDRVVALGETCMLLVPISPLHPLHAQIVSKQHQCLFDVTAESISTEIRNFKKSVLRMWSSQLQNEKIYNGSLGVLDSLGVFTQVITLASSSNSHLIIDAIPMVGVRNLRLQWKHRMATLLSYNTDADAVQSISKSKRPASCYNSVSVEFWLDDGYFVRIPTSILDEDDEDSTQNSVLLKEDWARRQAQSFLCSNDNFKEEKENSSLKSSFRPFDWTAMLASSSTIETK